MKNEIHSHNLIANKGCDAYGKRGVENAHYYVSVFVPHQKLLKFKNNNAILKLTPLPDGYNENPKC